MAHIDERLTQPPPVDELHRRWTKLRDIMREDKVDALIVAGQHGFSGGSGYFRWVTGTFSPTAYAQVAIFPADGLMTLVHHGDLGGVFGFPGSNELGLADRPHSLRAGRLGTVHGAGFAQCLPLP